MKPTLWPKSLPESSNHRALCKGRCQSRRELDISLRCHQRGVGLQQLQKPGHSMACIPPNFPVRNVGTCPEDLGFQSTRQPVGVSASSVTDVLSVPCQVGKGGERRACLGCIEDEEGPHSGTEARMVGNVSTVLEAIGTCPGQHSWSCKGKCRVCSDLWMACRRKHIRRCDYVVQRSQDVTPGPGSL